METPPHLQLLEDADAARARATSALLTDLEQVGAGVTRAAERVLPRLELAADGTVRATRGTLRAWAQLRARAAGAVGEGSPYAAAVERLITELRAPTRLAARYIEAVTGEALPAAAAETARYVEAALRERLLASGPAAVAEQLARAVPTVVGKRPDEIAAALRRRFVDEQAIPARLGTDITDATESASRLHLQTVSADLGLSHYFYKGTLITDSRGFCQSRVGKYFTQAQVEGWAALTWDGKNPATDAATIYTLLGGYRCRHRLVPVTESVYRERTGQAPAPPPRPALPPGHYAGAELGQVVKKKWGVNLPDGFYAQLPAGVKPVSGRSDKSFYSYPTQHLEIGRTWSGMKWTPAGKQSAVTHELGHAWHHQQGLLTAPPGSARYVATPGVDALYRTMQRQLADAKQVLDDNLGFKSFIGVPLEWADRYADRIDFAVDWSVTADIVGALTQGKRGSGHAPAYYANEAKCMAEILAHGVRCHYMENPYFRETLPELHQTLLRFISDRLP